MGKDLIFPAIGIDRLRMGRDGAGVTTLVAAYGCPLRCKYCLNPQCFMQDFVPRQYTVEALLEQVAIDDLYFQATGGGVAFGGGEPLLYADFIHEFRRRCPRGWKISLETSLNVPTGQLDKVMDDIDFYLIDCKDMNPSTYESYTGKKQDDLRNNLEKLSSRIVSGELTPERFCIRIPLIEGYNTEGEQQQSVDALGQMGFTDFDLFAYHTQLGREKLKKMSQK